MKKIQEESNNNTIFNTLLEVSIENRGNAWQKDFNRSKFRCYFIML